MKEDWIKQQRKKLEGHRKTPPPGLWEGISLQMNKPSGLTPLSRLTGTAHRYWAAAAAVLALVGLFILFHHDDSHPLLSATQTSQPFQFSEQRPSAAPSSEPLPSASPSEPQHLTGLAPQAERPLLALAPQQKKVSVASDTTEEAQPPVSESVQPSVSEPQTKPVPDEPQTKQTLDRPQTPHHPFVPKHEESSGSDKWSVALNASGGLLVAQTSQRVDRLYYDKADYSSNKEIDAVSITPMSYSLTEYVSEHHLPLRFGLSLNYQLSPRVALLTGINYTYLYSEFSIPLYPNASYNQKLHYLGIPLSLSYQLWTADHFRLYLSGGVMLEKCVSAHVDGITISDKPWQWSLEASAGAEYTIIPQLGFYLEPSLGYYFKDGTSLEHYYKEHPLTPSIEFGLRLHLKE